MSQTIDTMKSLEKDVMDRLTWDDRIDESQIQISVKDGIAILKGCVSTYPEKVLAEIETRLVPKIKSIENKIEVNYPGSYEIPSDENLKEAMFCLLDANSELDSNSIQVSVEGGTVFLEGVVDSYWKRKKIINMASQISGVRSVSNKILIIPEEKISDEEIKKVILTSMQNSVRIDTHTIDLKVEKGIVSLSGTVCSMSEYDAILDIVEFTKGVININNNLNWILRYHTT